MPAAICLSVSTCEVEQYQFQLGGVRSCDPSILEGEAEFVCLEFEAGLHSIAANNKPSSWSSDRNMIIKDSILRKLHVALQKQGPHIFYPFSL